MSRPLYFDYAAATPLDERVLIAMQPYFTDNFYNPSALYAPAQKVARDIAAARAQVAIILGARPSEIIFTAGGTEANNITIHGIMARYPGKNMITTSIEHDSVLAAARQYSVTEVGVRLDGRVDVATIVSAIDDNTVLVSVQYDNNEIGTVQPIRDIALTVKDIRLQRKATGNVTPLYFHTDACQASPYLDL